MVSYKVNRRKHYDATPRVKPNVKESVRDKIRGIETTEETKWVRGIDKGAPVILREHKKTVVTEGRR